MGTEYELLKDRVEKIGNILSAVNFDSPVVASHLLVAACVEGYRVYGELYNLCRKGKSMILTLGYRVSEPLEPCVRELADMLEKMIKDDCALVYFIAYQSNVLEKTSSFEFLLKDVEEAQKDVECALEDEKRVLKNIYRFCLDQSRCPLKIDHVSHYKSIYPMMDFLRSLMNELKKCAAKIDASASSPTAEMVACWMKNSFEAFKEKGLEASFLKKCFESDRRKVRLRNKSELEFLEKELDGYLNADGDSLLGAALFRNYDMETGECDFMKTAWEVLPHWDCVNDESTTDLEDYAENLMMAAYVRDEIARISGEQKAEDEPKVNKGAKGGLKKSFADSVINGDADEVLVFLRNELEGKSTQKDVMMVFRAVMNAGLTRKPTFKEFECDFASVVKVKINKSNFDKYLKKDFKFDESAFEYLVEKAKKLR